MLFFSIFHRTSNFPKQIIRSLSSEDVPSTLVCVLHKNRRMKSKEIQIDLVSNLYALSHFVVSSVLNQLIHHTLFPKKTDFFFFYFITQPYRDFFNSSDYLIGASHFSWISNQVFLRSFPIPEDFKASFKLLIAMFPNIWPRSLF